MKRVLASLSMIAVCLTAACGPVPGGSAGSSADRPKTSATSAADATSSTPTKSAPSFEAVGFISDSTCGANHSFMIKTGSMGETDESCVKECVRAGSRFVFVSNDGKHIFKLKDQESAGKFAGRKVKVLGDLCAYGKELDKMKIAPVESVPPAMPASTK